MSTEVLASELINYNKAPRGVKGKYMKSLALFITTIFLSDLLCSWILTLSTSVISTNASDCGWTKHTMGQLLVKNNSMRFIWKIKLTIMNCTQPVLLLKICVNWAQNRHTVQRMDLDMLLRVKNNTPALVLMMLMNMQQMMESSIMLQSDLIFTIIWKIIPWFGIYATVWHLYHDVVSRLVLAI